MNTIIKVITTLGGFYLLAFWVYLVLDYWELLEDGVNFITFHLGILTFLLTGSIIVSLTLLLQRLWFEEEK